MQIMHNKFYILFFSLSDAMLEAGNLALIIIKIMN